MPELQQYLTLATICRNSLRSDVVRFTREKPSDLAAQVFRGAVVNSMGVKRTCNSTRDLRHVAGFASIARHREMAWNSWDGLASSLPSGYAVKPRVQSLLASIRRAYSSNVWPDFGIDLIEAVKRQRSFVQRVTLQTQRFNLDAALTRYCRIHEAASCQKSHQRTILLGASARHTGR